MSERAVSTPATASEARRPLLRPKDAATLIIIDRCGPEPAVLMGKRHAGHAFMPDTYVFPGGRREAGDGRVLAADRLHPAVEAKLLGEFPRAPNTRLATGLAIAAVRETFEEAGIRIAAAGPMNRRPEWRAFVRSGLAPRLSCLRYIARAITPPRQKRRFDTRFFACFRDEAGEVPEAGAAPTGELLELRWVRPSEAAGIDMPRITRSILDDLAGELDNDPSLPFGRPVSFYRVRHGRFVHEFL